MTTLTQEEYEVVEGGRMTKMDYEREVIYSRLLRFVTACKENGCDAETELLSLLQEQTLGSDVGEVMSK